MILVRIIAIGIVLLIISYCGSPTTAADENTIIWLAEIAVQKSLGNATGVAINPAAPPQLVPNATPGLLPLINRTTLFSF